MPATGYWLAALQQAAAARGPLLVGFSGGLDSTVLLHALASSEAVRQHGLRALHVDHGLHPQSGAWAEHCLSVCANLGIALSLRRVVLDQAQLGPEGAARHARYAAFAAELQPGETLVLAHHRDDQAETVLLRLLRGSASRGLAAMAAQRAIGAGQLWRPLLAIGRDDLRAYGESQRLHWLDDPSNSEARFDRNFLRQQVLPLLHQRWPQASHALAHSARRLAEDADLLDQECARRLMPCRGPNADTLAVAALTALAPAWQSRVLRHWLAELGLPALNAQGVDTVLGPLLAARADAKPSFAWSGAVLHRWQGGLWAEFQAPRLPPDWQQAWDGCGLLTLPDGQVFALDRPDPATPLPLRVALRRGGERIRLPGRDHRSALKTVLQDAGVPPWQRARLPLLFAAEGELLAAGEVVRSQGLQELGWTWRRVASPRPSP